LKKLNLNDFLKFKTLYYDKIDYSYIKKAWQILSEKINLPYVIHIVGTNGKGSTGRFLSHYLHKKDFKVLHYSSPHIVKFNERIWINGSDVDDRSLEGAHDFLQDIYDDEILSKLTYFEYTTLLALYLSEGKNYLVLEAGLGGEFDATNVVENNLSLITTIDLDHQDFLGNTIEEIASTKMRSVDNKMILGYQVNPEVYDIALEVKKEIYSSRAKNIIIQSVKDFEKYQINNKFANYLKKNLHLVIETLNELNVNVDLNIFNEVKLFARCEKIKENITIDVGHNPLAARMLVKEFEGQKVTLIYNSYENKDYKRVLQILKPIIKNIYILQVDDKRIVNKNNLLNIIEDLNIITTEILNINDKEDYLVFGSFLVVEKFLQTIGFNEK
jgi:dihydrofolate synthase/folylpolyglutamate synthase